MNGQYWLDIFILIRIKDVTHIENIWKNLTSSLIMTFLWNNRYEPVAYL